MNESLLFDLRRLLRLHVELQAEKAKPKPVGRPVLIGVLGGVIGMILSCIVFIMLFGTADERGDKMQNISLVVGFIVFFLVGFSLMRKSLIVNADAKLRELEIAVNLAVEDICETHPTILEIAGSRERLQDHKYVADMVDDLQTYKGPPDKDIDVQDEVMDAVIKMDND